eukprot:1477863-Prymnesium_polylepis.1
MSLRAAAPPPCWGRACQHAVPTLTRLLEAALGLFRGVTLAETVEVAVDVVFTVEPLPVLASGAGKEAIACDHDHQRRPGHVHQVAPD